MAPSVEDADPRRSSTTAVTAGPPSLASTTVSRSNSFDDVSLSGSSCATTPVAATTWKYSSPVTITSAPPQLLQQYPPTPQSMADAPATDPQEEASQTTSCTATKGDSYPHNHPSSIVSASNQRQIVPTTRHDGSSTDDDDDNTSEPLLLTEAIHPNKYKMKQQRRGATALGAVGGAVVGTMVFPVIGTAVGGYATGYVCHKLSKQGERRAQRRWERSSFQRQASQSHAVNAVYV